MGCGSSVFDGLFCYNKVMQIILDGFKSTLKCLVLFWCPFGRTSRKTYQYFIITCVICGVGLVGVFWGLSHYYPLILSKLLIRTLPYLYLGGIILIVAFLMAIIRRGHDLEIGAFSAILSMASRSTSFFLRLSQEEGSPEPNKYGPAPKENQL